MDMVGNLGGSKQGSNMTLFLIILAVGAIGAASVMQLLPHETEDMQPQPMRKQETPNPFDPDRRHR